MKLGFCWLEREHAQLQQERQQFFTLLRKISWNKSSKLTNQLRIYSWKWLNREIRFKSQRISKLISVIETMKWKLWSKACLKMRMSLAKIYMKAIWNQCKKSLSKTWKKKSIHTLAKWKKQLKKVKEICKQILKVHWNLCKTLVRCLLRS